MVSSSRKLSPRVQALDFRAQNTSTKLNGVNVKATSWQLRNYRGLEQKHSRERKPPPKQPLICSVRGPLACIFSDCCGTAVVKSLRKIPDRDYRQNLIDWSNYSVKFHERFDRQFLCINCVNRQTDRQG